MKKLFELIEDLNTTQKKQLFDYLKNINSPSDSLFNHILELNASQKKRVLDFVNALKRPCHEWINEESTYVDGRFAEEFRSRVLTQHAFQHTPLFQDTFDSAFYAAISATGKKVEMAPPGERFWDLKIDDFHISLKSTKEKSLSLNKLKISKLTEAAWIQDCRTAAKREKETKYLFETYIKTVGTIFQLRYFAKKRYYELVEIPVELFSPILDVPREYFNSDGPTINIPAGDDNPILKLKIDRSDAKITINGILKDHCVLHGTWQLL